MIGISSSPTSLPAAETQNRAATAPSQRPPAGDTQIQLLPLQRQRNTHQQRRPMSTWRPSASLSDVMEIDEGEEAVPMSTDSSSDFDMTELCSIVDEMQALKARQKYGMF